MLVWRLENVSFHVYRTIDGRRVLTFSCEEGDGSAVATSSSCSTNSVNIVLRIVRVVIIEDMCNVSDIFRTG